MFSDGAELFSVCANLLLRLVKADESSFYCHRMGIQAWSVQSGDSPLVHDWRHGLVGFDLVELKSVGSIGCTSQIRRASATFL